MKFSFNENRIVWKTAPRQEANPNDDLSDWYETLDDEALIETPEDLNHPQNAIIDLLRTEHIEEAADKIEKIYKWHKGHLASGAYKKPYEITSVAQDIHQIVFEKNERVKPVRDMIQALLNVKRRGAVIPAEQERIRKKLTGAIRTKQAAPEALEQTEANQTREVEMNKEQYEALLARCIAMVGNLKPSDLEPTRKTEKQARQHKKEIDAHGEYLESTNFKP